MASRIFSHLFRRLFLQNSSSQLELFAWRSWKKCRLKFMVRVRGERTKTFRPVTILPNLSSSVLNSEPLRSLWNMPYSWFLWQSTLFHSLRNKEHVLEHRFSSSVWLFSKSWTTGIEGLQMQNYNQTQSLSVCMSTWIHCDIILNCSLLTYAPAMEANGGNYIPVIFSDLKFLSYGENLRHS